MGKLDNELHLMHHAAADLLWLECLAGYILHIYVLADSLRKEPAGAFLQYIQYSVCSKYMITFCLVKNHVNIVDWLQSYYKITIT